jgi:hypothetical protein
MPGSRKAREINSLHNELKLKFFPLNNFHSTKEKQGPIKGRSKAMLTHRNDTCSQTQSVCHPSSLFTHSENNSSAILKRKGTSNQVPLLKTKANPKWLAFL